LLWTQKQFPEAAHEFQAELENNPKHLQSLVYLADSDVQMNQMDAARPVLQTAIKIDPTAALAHLDLGIIAAEDGRNDDALREFLAAEKGMPNDVNVHWRLARLYRTLGRKEEAKAEFDKASILNKKADDDLFDLIQHNAKRPPPQADAPPAPAPQTQP
jgi:tetratricopeptide (TPR) repeat protein